PGDVLNRLVILSIFLAVWAVYPRLGVKTIRLGRLNRSRLKVGLFSLALGFAAVTAFFVYKYLAGHGVFDWQRIVRFGLGKTLAWYALGAVTVAFIEEIFFRGIALQVFYQDKRTARWAIALSALLFAAVHFIDFQAIAQMTMEGNAGYFRFFTGVWLKPALWYKFGLLAVLGAVLAYLCQRTGSLYAAIGFHAGLVLAVRIAGKAFVAAPGYAADILAYSGSDLIITGAALAGAVALARFLPRDLRHAVRLEK
ncbi:MAG: CPBP family intramembrane metalloprotease, partial [Negativicutes bacterium]|nr:CPBP family intramembrane metalloprotease [Negativicutes bacterium]